MTRKLIDYLKVVLFLVIDVLNVVSGQDRAQPIGYPTIQVVGDKEGFRIRVSSNAIEGTPPPELISEITRTNALILLSYENCRNQLELTNQQIDSLANLQANIQKIIEPFDKVYSKDEIHTKEFGLMLHRLSRSVEKEFQSQSKNIILPFQIELLKRLSFQEKSRLSSFLDVLLSSEFSQIVEIDKGAKVSSSASTRK